MQAPLGLHEIEHIDAFLGGEVHFDWGWNVSSYARKLVTVISGGVFG